MTLTCRACGSHEIYEVSMVPRSMRLVSFANKEYDETDDEAFWEAETIIGYGCGNDRCHHWNGDVDANVTPRKGSWFDDVAEEEE